MSIEQQNQIRELQRRVDELESLVRKIADNQALTSNPRIEARIDLEDLSQFNPSRRTLSLPPKAKTS